MTELTTTAKVAQYARLAAMPVVVVGAAALALAVVPVGAAVYGVYSLKKRSSALRRRRARRRRVTRNSGDHGHEFVIGLFGDHGVGKTSIAIQFARGEFPDVIDPDSSETYRRAFQNQGQTTTVEVLDAHVTEFLAFRDAYLARIPYLCFIYSITDRNSFEGVKTYINRAETMKEVERLPPSMLLGNKLDLDSQRQISEAEGYQLASQHNLLFYEATAKSKPDIDICIANIISAARRNRFMLT